MQNFWFVTVILFGMLTKCYSLKCYVCGFSSTDTDRSCLTITNSTQTVDCIYDYCTIMRQEFIDPSGEIASFIRNCEKDPIFLNHEIEDPTFRSFYRACTNDLCNIGNGIQSVTGGSLSPTPEYNGLNLLVPGTGSSATQLRAIIMYNLLLMLFNLTLGL